MSSAPTLKCVVFCGHRSSLGLYFLQALATSAFEVDTVVVASEARWQRFDQQLNKSTSSGWRPYFHKFRSWINLHIHLQSMGSPRLVYSDDINDPDFLATLKNRQIPLFFCAAYPQLFGPEILALPVTACINIHPSLLPAYAGAHPHFWAIREGADVSGVTAHRMTEVIDSGERLAQVSIPLSELTYAAFYREIGTKLPLLLQYLADFFLSGKVPVLYDGPLNASRHRNNQPADSEIIWEKHRLREIRNIIRTGTAFFHFQGQVVRVLDATYHFQKPPAPPGTLLQADRSGIRIAAQDGFLQISRFKRNFRPIGPREATRYWGLKP